jgi:ankyrin repeat protein
MEIDNKLNIAAKNGQLQAIKNLFKKHPSCLTYSIAMSYAAENGHLDIVKFLSSNNAYTQDALLMARKNKHKEVIDYLLWKNNFAYTENFEEKTQSLMNP